MSLSLCGNRVDELTVLSIPEPVGTSSWSPVSHSRVIQALENEVKDAGFKIIRREYSLSSPRKGSKSRIEGIEPAFGDKMFGVWDLQNGHSGEGTSWSLGFRNSLNKTLALGICAGQRVFVCDNLSFTGEFVDFRRHTAGLSQEELEHLAAQAVGKVISKFEDFDVWIEQLRKFKLSTRKMKGIIYDSIVEGINSSKKFKEIHALILGTSPTYKRNLYGFHEASTELMKGSSLFTVNDKNAMLNSFLHIRMELWELLRN